MAFPKTLDEMRAQRGSDEAVAHWATCTEQDSFRKKN